jgi:hypothetical protein
MQLPGFGLLAVGHGEGLLEGSLPANLLDITDAVPTRIRAEWIRHRTPSSPIAL